MCVDWRTLRAQCLGVTILAAMVLMVGVGVSSPSNASVVQGDDWELEFEPGPLRLYIDPVDRKTYWYFIYTVANRTDRDRMWAPRLEIFTDEGKIHRSGRNVPSRVSSQLRKLQGDPLLEDQNRIIGELLVGRENARSGLAVWPAQDLDVTELTLFVAGLSSDALIIQHPITGQDVRLQKTLRREYLVPGNPLERGSKPLMLEPRKNRRGPECEHEYSKGGCWIYR